MGRPKKTAWSLCRRKKFYGDELEAKTAAIALLELPDVNRVRVYPCRFCGGYHVTRGSGWCWIFEAKKEPVTP